MQPGLSRTVDRLRQPEYTGENRCVPCTILNVVIAVVLAVAVGVVFVPAGAVAFVVSLLAIYFRGYLIPGTPTFTKRYVPDWILAKFDKGPTALESDVTVGGEPGEGSAGGGELDDVTVDPETLFLDSEVLEPCVDVDDLCLVDDVRTRWGAFIDDALEKEPEHLAAAFLEVEPGRVNMRTMAAGPISVSVDDRVAARWESEAALIADVTASSLLAERVDGWEDYPLEVRSQLASGLRAFVESCPTCEGDISLDEETVESCCRSHEVYAVTCESCGSRILEVTQ